MQSGDILRQYQHYVLCVSPSSRGLGHRVFIPATRVRIPLEMPFFCLFSKNREKSLQKAILTLANKICPVRIFLFAVIFFAFSKKNWDFSLYHGLPCAARPAVCAARAHSLRSCRIQLVEQPLRIIRSKSITPRQQSRAKKIGIAHFTMGCPALLDLRSALLAHTRFARVESRWWSNHYGSSDQNRSSRDNKAAQKNWDCSLYHGLPPI